MPRRTLDSSVKGLPTKHTSKPVYIDRQCVRCSKYPCFQGIEKMKTDFAKAGCLDWDEINMVGNK